MTNAQTPVKGMLGFFGLSDWYLQTFTDAERVFIYDTFSPLGFGRGSHVEGDISSTSDTPYRYLEALAGWFYKTDFDKEIAAKFLKKSNEFLNSRSCGNDRWLSLAQCAIVDNEFDKAEYWLDAFKRAVCEPTDELKNRYKSLREYVAHQNPWLIDLYSPFLHYLAANPDVLQTDVYKALPDCDSSIPYDCEQYRLITRVKKGRTYSLKITDIGLAYPKKPSPLDYDFFFADQTRYDLIERVKHLEGSSDLYPNCVWRGDQSEFAHGTCIKIDGQILPVHKLRAFVISHCEEVKIGCRCSVSTVSR